MRSADAARRGLLHATLLNILWSMLHSLLFIAAPLAVKVSGGGDWLLGLAALLYDAGYALLSPLAGSLGDRGYRRTLIVASLAFMLSSLALLEASVWSREPLYAVAAKLLLGVAGAAATPNIAALFVDVGVVSGLRVETILARYYGASTTIGWFAGYALGGLFSRLLGFEEGVALYGLAVASLLAPVAAAMPRPPVHMEHRLPALRARIRFHHERVLRARFPGARRLLERLTRTPLLAAYLATVAAFTGIGVFFALLPAYWLERGLEPSSIMLVASVHTVASSLTYLYADRLVSRLGAERSLALAYALRALVFYEPVATSTLPAYQQAIATYTLTGVTWALLNTSLNTLAAKQPGGRGARLGAMQAAASTGLVAGDAIATLLGGIAGPSTWFTVASLMEALAATILALSTREATTPRPAWRGLRRVRMPSRRLG